MDSVTTPSREQEGDLLIAVAGGDEGAMRQLYGSFERPLYSLGTRWFSGDTTLAEELVQEVTLRIWRRASSFDPARGRASSWIFGMARNVANDLARSRERDPTPVAEVADPTQRPWDEADSWRSWEMARAIRSLPSEQQQAIELVFICQFTHSEAARTLDIPLGTLKTRIQLALVRLQRVLAETGVLDAAGV